LRRGCHYDLAVSAQIETRRSPASCIRPEPRLDEKIGGDDTHLFAVRYQYLPPTHGGFWITHNGSEILYTMKLFLNPHALPAVAIPEELARAFNAVNHVDRW